MQPSDKVIVVGGRDSNLSKIQVEEVFLELKRINPHILFENKLIKSTGDYDQKTSLRTLDKKSDFFTREIDEMLLEGKCHIAVHSAKDLPEPLRKGIVIVALTKGVDSSDSLVISENQTLDSLPHGAIIATSSARREEAVKALRDDFVFVDIRGTIEKRLEKLTSHEVDGVVIAEAALIRLGLTHLNRITLPGETATFQGRLAICARENDVEMAALFKPLYYLENY